MEEVGSRGQIKRQRGMAKLRECDECGRMGMEILVIGYVDPGETGLRLRWVTTVVKPRTQAMDVGWTTQHTDPYHPRY